MAAKSVMTATVRATKKLRSIPTRSPLTLTPAAVSQIKVLMKENPSMAGLKIGVKTRGCSGLSYTLEYCNEKKKFDEEVVQDGVKVFIDSKAQLTLLGTEMDFVDNRLGSEFVFNNPNVKGTCGCGESFTV